MTCKNQQVKLLMKNLKIHKKVVAATKAGMDVKTARKYERSCLLPSELNKPHDWVTRKDKFAEVWKEIEVLLTNAPNLQAKTVFEYLKNKYPEGFVDGQLRTLQRRFRDWRVENGNEKAIIFAQKHIPGLQSQSDYTDMRELEITIVGQAFKHLLFHFMLTYSRWEAVLICYEESFASLAQGYEYAVWKLGGVTQEHRTDNLSAATKQAGNERVFTERWQQVLQHYGVIPTRNNPGEGHENGSIEKSHDLFKTAVDQQLMLRGSRDFKSLTEYQQFLTKIVGSRNQSRKERLIEELPKLKALPNDKWYSPKVLPVKVSPSSTVQVDGVAYSVPSRLISYSLMAHIYPDKVLLYYGQKCLQEMPKVKSGAVINYRHVVDSLLRKPGAFKNYQYQKALFPSLCFRQAYEQLVIHSQAKGHKFYLQVLQLAKLHGEQQVAAALTLLLEKKDTPLPEDVKALLDVPIKIPEVTVDILDLATYDQLLYCDLSKEVVV